MFEMFYGCSSLKELNLNNFKTNKSTKVWRMFGLFSNELKTKR